MATEKAIILNNPWLGPKIILDQFFKPFVTLNEALYVVKKKKYKLNKKHTCFGTIIAKPKQTLRNVLPCVLIKCQIGKC